MGHVTEEDIVSYYRFLVIEECQNGYKGLEPDNRLAEGMAALFHSVRTYNTRYGPFKDYALIQIRNFLKQKNTQAWAEKRLSFCFSLDAPLKNKGENNHFTLKDCLTNESIDLSAIDTKLFISSLNPQEQKVIWMRMHGYSLQHISNAMTISFYGVKKILKTIGVKFMKHPVMIRPTFRSGE